MGLETWSGQTDMSSPESEGFSDKELNEIYHIIPTSENSEYEEKHNCDQR